MRGDSGKGNVVGPGPIVSDLFSSIPQSDYSIATLPRKAKSRSKILVGVTRWSATCMPPLRGIQRGTPQATREAASPPKRLEHALHPWAVFVIMPVFALADAGVKVEVHTLATPVALAVTAGLMLGKPLGIILFSYASVRMGFTQLPEGLDWKMMLGAGCLGGIVFTMSLFIAGLALKRGVT
jgi:Na+/H+ antiporter NhaA